MSNETTQNCFGGFEINKPGPWQVTAADGDVFEEHDTQEAATAVAEAWNAQADPLERTHEGAYPFLVEHRTQRAIDAQLKRLERFQRKQWAFRVGLPDRRHRRCFGRC